MTIAGVDSESLEKALQESHEFKKLYSEHQELERKLAKLSKSPHLPPEQEVEKKKLQKTKLTGKDQMFEILKKISAQNN